MAADLVVARRVLEETQRNSWRLIWDREIKSVTSVGNTNSPLPIPVIQPLTAALEQGQPSGPAQNPPEQSKPLHKNSPFFGRTRAAEIAALFNAKSRVAVGKALSRKGGKAIWDLLVQALDAGFLQASDTAFERVTSHSGLARDGPRHVALPRPAPTSA